ncbi:TauD/TfdA family dioxygenase [Marinomonas sp. TW1]|uniref:TauD/TfdA family dioxygenase n=1 Tax=Marinomonas sp. TW1 TaxID=1561203 RepID=UPI0007AF16A7|nr:TauD/TfdA family dioxygenase [Marinomonas sp. TW1]KZN15368.1 hypothetical protein OA79_00880 [Marinomonas sp. TW1]
MDIALPLQVMMENTAGWRNDLENMHRVVEEGLHKHGGILFRGFDILGESEFQAFAKTFGFPLLREHKLQPVRASLHVFWSSKTLQGSRYQKAALKGEWDLYGQIQETTIEGDHESIVRDRCVASHILNLMEGEKV